MRRQRFRFSRAIAAPIALTLLLATAVTATADTRARISAAKRRLAALEAQISAEQSRADVMAEALKTQAAAVGRARVSAEQIAGQVVQTRMRRELVEAEYRALQNEIGKVAARAYMQGPGYAVNALLDLDSLHEVTQYLQYTNAIARRDADLAVRARAVAEQLTARQREETALLARRDAAAARLASEQDALARSFADQQARLAELARAQTEADALLVRLRKQLRAEELAAALAALRSGTPISFGRWAGAFLDSIHAPVARGNLVVVVAWETAEYTRARWNPLATTYSMPGSTTFNSSGVRNYVSLRQGLDATVKTLRHRGYGYESILVDLARNADPMTTAQAINDSRWCRGCANGGYVVDLVPAVEQYYDSYANASSSS